MGKKFLELSTIHILLVITKKHSSSVCSLFPKLTVTIREHVSTGCVPRLFFDNLDFKILVNIILQNHCPSDMHWIIHYVTFDRVPCYHLDDSKPLSDGTQFDNIEYLLSQGELDKLQSDFIVLVARILADFFVCMEPLQSAIPKHIQHRQ